MNIKKFIQTVVILLLGLETGLVVSNIWAGFMPVIIVGVIIIILVILLMKWSNIATPRLKQIDKRIAVHINELIVDKTRLEVNVGIVIENKNKFSAVKLLMFYGGKVNLDSTMICRLIRLGEPSSREVLATDECKANIWFTLDKLEYLHLLEEKQREKTEAYWSFSISANFGTPWGDLYLKRQDILYSAVPRIGG